jgi:hypothetical protein
MWDLETDIMATLPPRSDMTWAWVRVDARFLQVPIEL